MINQSADIGVQLLRLAGAIDPANYRNGGITGQPPTRGSENFVAQVVQGWGQVHNVRRTPPKKNNRAEPSAVDCWTDRFGLNFRSGVHRKNRTDAYPEPMFQPFEFYL